MKNKIIKKSVLLSEPEQDRLQEYYDSFHTDLDFADALKMNRVTAKRILKEGSGREDKIAIIRKRLNKIVLATDLY